MAGPCDGLPINVVVLKSGHGASERPWDLRAAVCVSVLRTTDGEYKRSLRVLASTCAPHAYTCVHRCCTRGGSDFQLQQASCWSPVLRGRCCQVPDRIRERLPKETLSPARRNKLSCVQEKGHCSVGVDSLEFRINLEGVGRLLWTQGW